LNSVAVLFRPFIAHIININCEGNDFLRDYKIEFENRVAFIKETLSSASAAGIVFGNSGGKDAALVGILCKAACNNTVGVITPCESKRNFGEDKEHAQILAKQFNIESRMIDLTMVKQSLLNAVNNATTPSAQAAANIAPRLRMTAWNVIAQTENRLLAGTGNRSEIYMGYFTKFGDGAYDFNPISDLTVTEVYEFLRYLNAPECIINKSPSAGLFEGQTDEAEMGVTYKSIDTFLLCGATSEHDTKIIQRHNNASEHKRKMPIVYKGE